MSTLQQIIQTTQQLLKDHGYTTTKTLNSSYYVISYTTTQTGDTYGLPSVGYQYHPTHVTLTILLHNDPEDRDNQEDDSITIGTTWNSIDEDYHYEYAHPNFPNNFIEHIKKALPQ